MSLTPEQSTFASGLGNTLDRHLTGVVATCFWYGMFALLILISVVLHMQRKTVETKFAQHILFTATVASFVISSVYVGARLAVMYILMDNVLATGGSERLLEFEIRLLPALNAVTDWAAYFPTLIIDGTIIWGAWAVCNAWFSSKRWVITFPCLLWFGTFATTFTYVTWISTPAGFILSIRPTPNVINDLLVAGVALSNSTNFSATLLFGWTLWHLRSGLGTQPTAVKTFLTFIIESGTVYFTIQLVYLGFLLKAPPAGTVGSYFWIFFAPTYTMFSAMYPTVIMILKASRPSSDAVVAGFRLPKVPTLNLSSITDPGPRNPASAHPHACLPPHGGTSPGVLSASV